MSSSPSSTKKSFRKTKSKNSEQSDNIKNKTLRNKNYTIHHTLSNHIPKELIREVSSFLNKKEKVVVGKTPWMNFPKIEYLYEYEENSEYYNPYAEENYEIENEISMDTNVRTKLENCIKDYIFKTLGKQKNKTVDILPTDVERILVTIAMSPRRKKNGEKYENMVHPPHRLSNRIHIYSTRTMPNTFLGYYAYDVKICSVTVEMKDPKKLFPKASYVKCTKTHKLKMFAYII